MLIKYGLTAEKSATGKHYYQVQSGDYCMGIVEKYERAFSLQEL